MTRHINLSMERAGINSRGVNKASLVSSLFKVSLLIQYQKATVLAAVIKMDSL